MKGLTALLRLSFSFQAPPVFVYQYIYRVGYAKSVHYSISLLPHQVTFLDHHLSDSSSSKIGFASKASLNKTNDGRAFDSAQLVYSSGPWLSPSIDELSLMLNVVNDDSASLPLDGIDAVFSGVGIAKSRFTRCILHDNKHEDEESVVSIKVGSVEQHSSNCLQPCL